MDTTSAAGEMRYIELHHDLSGRLALDAAQRILIWLPPDTGTPQVTGVAMFTESEWALLVPVLEQHPDYCPFEVLLASFGGKVNEKAVERARKLLNQALEDGDVENMLKPMRNVMSRVRLKVRAMGLDIVSIYQTGYILMPVKK